MRPPRLDPAPPSPRRRFAYPCLDWSERRDHLAGQLADEMFQHFTDQGWLHRANRRAVEITVEGGRVMLPFFTDTSTPSWSPART